MSFDIRPLVAQVGLARPDVDSALIVFCVEEGVREVCRRTHLAQMTQDYTVTANTNAVTVALSADKSYIRTMRALWMGASDTQWEDLEEISFRDALDFEVWKLAGNVQQWSQQTGNVLIYGTPTENGTLRLVSSYVPLGSFDTVPLPEVATSAIACKASALALGIPGPGQNAGMAMAKDTEFRRSIGNLRARAMVGEGGSPSFRVTPYF